MRAEGFSQEFILQLPQLEEFLQKSRIIFTAGGFTFYLEHGIIHTVDSILMGFSIVHS